VSIKVVINNDEIELNEEFLLRNYYNFLFYNIEGKKPTNKKPELNTEYLKISELRNAINRSANLRLESIINEKEYVDLLKEPFDKLMTETSISKQLFRPTKTKSLGTEKGIPKPILDLIKDKPLEELLNDDFIRSIMLVQRDTTENAPKKEKELVGKVLEGLGNDDYLIDYIKKNSTAKFNKGRLTTFTFDESINDKGEKRKKLEETIGLKNRKIVATAKGAGKKQPFAIGTQVKKDKFEYDGEEIDDSFYTDKVKLIISNEDFDNIKEVYDWFVGDSFDFAMQDEVLMPLHAKLQKENKKKKEKAKRDIKTEDEESKRMYAIEETYKELSYDDWEEENKDKITEVKKAYTSLLIKFIIEKFGYSEAALKRKRDAEIDTANEQHINNVKNAKGKELQEKAKEHSATISAIEGKYKKEIDNAKKISKPLGDLKRMSLEDARNIIERFFGESSDESVSIIRDAGHTDSEGNASSLGKILEEAKQDGDTVDKATIKEIYHWTKKKLGNPINDLYNIYQLKLNMNKKKGELILHSQFNVSKGESMQTGRSRTVKETSEGKVPQGLQTKFNTMINKFRKNVRVIKRTLR